MNVFADFISLFCLFILVTVKLGGKVTIELSKYKKESRVKQKNGPILFLYRRYPYFFFHFLLFKRTINSHIRVALFLFLLFFFWTDRISVFVFFFLFLLFALCVKHRTRLPLIAGSRARYANWIFFFLSSCSVLGCVALCGPVGTHSYDTALVRADRLQAKNEDIKRKSRLKNNNNNKQTKSIFCYQSPYGIVTSFSLQFSFILFSLPLLFLCLLY